MERGLRERLLLGQEHQTQQQHSLLPAALELLLYLGSGWRKSPEGDGGSQGCGTSGYREEENHKLGLN